MDEKCVFCGIISKKIPSFGVYEDGDFIVFLDINPLNKGHALVVSKKHYRWTYDVPNFGLYWEVAKKIAIAAMNGLDAKYIQFITAGMGVAHAHIHVIPRYDNDGHGEYVDPHNVKKFTEQEYKQIAQKLRESMPVEKPPEIKSVRIPRVKSKKYTAEQMAAFRRDTEQT